LDGKIGLRLDQYAGPAQLFKMPGLRAFERIIGAHLGEKTASCVAEKRAHHPLLFVMTYRGCAHVACLLRV